MKKSRNDEGRKGEKLVHERMALRILGDFSGDRKEAKRKGGGGGHACWR